MVISFNLLILDGPMIVQSSTALKSPSLSGQIFGKWITRSSFPPGRVSRAKILVVVVRLRGDLISLPQLIELQHQQKVYGLR